MSNLSERFYARVSPEPNTGCWLWDGDGYGSGYGRIWVSDSDDIGGSRQTGAHRISWLIHRGDIPDGLFVCHRCDVRPCVNPDHLFLGTQSDNVRDMHAKLRHPRTGAKGERHWSAKLSTTVVAEIRVRYALGDISQLELALEYGVSRPTIGHIVRRETWA